MGETGSFRFAGKNMSLWADLQGDGGRGGDVILQVDEGLRTLIDFRYQRHFKAERGENGKPKNQHGKSADDLVIKVPPGTVVRDRESGRILGDLTRHGQRLVVARGGRGGRGTPITPLLRIKRRAWRKTGSPEKSAGSC